MEGKTRVYLCSGCGIGDCVNMAALSSTVKRDCKLSEDAIVHPFLCSEEAVAKIKDDTAAEPACNVVIGACSGRVLTDVFRFAPETVVERANLREQMAWRRGADEDKEDTQMLAADILRMSVAKAQKTTAPEPFIASEMSRSVLVVGGGFAGLSAALDCANAGYDVVLVEQEPALGGWMAMLYKDTPQGEPYREIETPVVQWLIEDVQKHPRIQVLTSAQIEKIAGQPGQFDVTVKTNGSAENAGAAEMRAGSIILATGAKPYDAGKLAHL
ncbi:CoB--CoM heterodisulfide reductase iron-sulfur subunit A family protein, partial [Candidatus Sumerlaeota bacterium]|nr:CoB--CoM heterodisulfide reductase iron-sulfur subunit A family protein [Candidatus Sumerlaeota bacterium]